MFTTLTEHSCILTVLSSLGSHRLDAGSCTVASRFWCRPCGREYIVRGLFDGSLPCRLTSWTTFDGTNGLIDSPLPDNHFSGFQVAHVGTFSKGSRTVRSLPALPCRLRAVGRAA